MRNTPYTKVQLMAGNKPAFDRLEPKQKDFVTAYSKTLDYKEALRAAGYSKGYAPKLLENPLIKQAIYDMTSQAGNPARRTAENIFNDIAWAVDVCKKSKDIRNLVSLLKLEAELLGVRQVNETNINICVSSHLVEAKERVKKLQEKRQKAIDASFKIIEDSK